MRLRVAFGDVSEVHKVAYELVRNCLRVEGDKERREQRNAELAQCFLTAAGCKFVLLESKNSRSRICR
ncbi:hypothetical protein E2542_SST27764 [Spatholobus suberectus]|nr:hypothetical protein E2542_SST27764 [Spatholobus suberectus]